MDYYIKVYNDIIPSQDCDDMIKYYEDHVNGSQFDHEWRRCGYYPLYSTEDGMLYKVRDYVNKVFERYKNDIGILGGCGTLYFCNTLEIPNIMCYKHDANPEHKFNVHSDAWSVESATRQLSLIIYLNDVEEGGETRLVHNDMNIKPTKGSILVFPSNFCYTHEGKKPVSNDKYIIVSWIHFDGAKSYSTISLK